MHQEHGHHPNNISLEPIIAQCVTSSSSTISIVDLGPNTHYSGLSGILKFRRYNLQPVPAHGPLYYVTQYDAISGLPDIIGASTSAFSGYYRSQFYGYHHGVKSYKTRPLNDYQAMMRVYKDEPRVGLQYCHIPTQSTCAKILAENDKDKRHRLPGTFPCVTTGSIVAHPTVRQ